MAIEAVEKADKYAYRDRKTTQAGVPRSLDRAHQRGRTAERPLLQPADGGPEARPGVEIDRKVLAQLALDDPKGFSALAERAKGGAA